jgi:ABC-type multidrug transport system ATPase subunit
MCDQVGLLSDGELLLLDTPKNLRAAAFAGEVVDVVTTRPLAKAELERLGDLDFVVGEIERTDVSAVRIVVDDADRAIAEVTAAFETLGVDLVEVGEHEVDYDEAFVRVVQRHRTAGDGGLVADEPGDDAEEAEIPAAVGGTGEPS